MAAAFTALAFALDVVKGFYPARAEPRWLWPPSEMLHGWKLIAVNLAFYAYCLWILFWLVRRTHPLERLFWVGCGIGLLLWPFAWLRPQWVLPRLAGFIGITIALFTAISVVVRPTIIDNVQPKKEVS